MKEHNEIIKKLKEQDPERYKKIQENVENRIEKLTKSKCEYVIDPEGYYTKIPVDEITEGYTVISEQEYKDAIGHGGPRPKSGRKKIFKDPVKATYEFEKETLIKFRDYAKKHKKSQNELLNDAVKKIINQ